MAPASKIASSAQASEFCPTCTRKVRQTRPVITCRRCFLPVHVQCVDEKYIVCFPCLEKLGNSVKLGNADPDVVEVVRRKKKSMGL